MATYSERLNRIIPGGAHTYSRGDDQYPENAPQILERGEGCYVWEPGGRKFLDYGMALRAVTLGYGYKPVAEAAIAEIYKGNNLTRASVTELEAAELLASLIPCAEMVKFAKNGSTVTSAAMKLARAYTGREIVAICAEHPFFSYDDWFIGSTVMDKGIDAETKSRTVKFSYNDIASLEKVFAAYPGKIACVMLEPVTGAPPKDDFLRKVKDLCVKNGAVFVLDEMITGFRWHLSGAQTLYDIKPDLATFGKGMANGFSVAALAGKREIMELGGIKAEGAERVFLVSTTHGAEMCGLGAFIAAMAEYRKHDVIKHLWTYGEKLINGLNAAAKEAGIGDHFRAEGFPCSPGYMTFGKDGKASLPLRTLFSQEMIKGGVLMPWIALSLAHGETELELTLNAARAAFKTYARALEDGTEKHLKGRAIRPVFRKHN